MKQALKKQLPRLLKENGAYFGSDFEELGLGKKESENAQVIAGEKLEKIMGYFTDYAVRAMSLLEFRNTILTGKRGGTYEGDKDVWMPNHQFEEEGEGQPEKKGHESFKDYLRETEDWESQIYNQTLWQRFQITAYRELTETLREIAKEVRGKGAADPKSSIIREFKQRSFNEKVKQFSKRLAEAKSLHENIREQLREMGMQDQNIDSIEKLVNQSRLLRGYEGYFEYWSVRHGQGITEQQGELLDKILQYRQALDVLGEDNIDTLVQCAGREEWIEESGNVKKFIHLMVQLEGKDLSGEFKVGSYDVALILDIAAVYKANRAKGYVGDWGYTKEEVEGQKILGAVALYSDPILIEKLVDIASRGKEAACPVFTPRGNTVFPKRS